MSNYSIFASLVIYGSIGLIVQVIFEIFKSEREIYSPKKLSNQLPTPTNDISSRGLDWIFACSELSNKEILDTVGMDAFVFLRFIKLYAKVFSICAVFGAVGTLHSI